MSFSLNRVLEFLGRAFVIVSFVACCCFIAAFMWHGDWGAYVLCSAALLLYFIPKAFLPAHYPDALWQFWACRFAVCVGIGALLFAGWRYWEDRLLEKRLDAYVSATDVASLLRAARRPPWPCNQEVTQDALHRALGREAAEQFAGCAAAGDTAPSRPSQILVWNLGRGATDDAQALLDRARIYQTGDGALTVYVVGGKHSIEVGTYSVSHRPAFRELVNVCAVRFDTPTGPGAPVRFHEVLSFDPARVRVVSNLPEHADPAPAIAEWIKDYANLTAPAQKSP